MSARIPTLTTITNHTDAAQAKTHARQLTARECDKARDIFKAFRQFCRKNELLAPSLLADAGAVANSYKYQAEATFLKIATQGENDQIVVSAWRDRARKIRGGGPGQMTLCATKPEGDAREWKDIPAFKMGNRTYKLNYQGQIKIAF